MSKTLKMSILLVIITLGFLFLGTEVKAVYIEPTTLAESFSEKDVTINGTTITLNDDVDFLNDIVEIFDGDFVINLNGHTLSAEEVYISDGKLTIEDSKGNGELASWLWVEESGELIINNGKFGYLVNNGTTTINNGTIENLTNDGTITINAGNFSYFWQRKTATIKGGTFGSSTIELDNGKTTITGNIEFNKTNDDETALTVLSANSIDTTVINQLLVEGYISSTSGYGMSSYPDELRETGYCYEVTYEPVKIIKDETDSIFNKVAPDGVWTVNGVMPKDMEESDFLLTSIASEVEVPEGYQLMAWALSGDNFDPEIVELSIYYNEGYLKSKTVKAVYNEPSEAITTKVNSILNKIAEKTGEEADVDTGFRVEDLYLINYLNTSSKGINGSLALNFSKDLIALTNGGNISYRYDSRKGAFTPTGLWSFTGGRVIVYYNNVGVGTAEIGLTTNHVLYVPSTTANTDDARIEAALKRIEEYLGSTTGITIEVGGTLESLNKEEFTWKDYGFIDENTSGSNYYNVKINGNTYKFAICMKDSDKLETPKYIGSDVISNVSVTSDITTIPLDTAVMVKEVEDNSIKQTLGTSIYVAYDISLYSNTKQASITKLDNGEFIVSIPVPENLKDIENLTVYYINSKGEKEEHIATIKDGIASFKTDHFSTYVLTEKIVEIEKTYKLILDTNGGKFSDGKTKLEFEDVTKCDITKIEIPVKDGYTFKGWYTEKSGGISFNTVMNGEEGIQKDTTFYAQWEENSGEVEPPIDEDVDNTQNGNNPQTSDNILFFVELLVIAVVGISVTTKYRKYSRTK